MLGKGVKLRTSKTARPTGAQRVGGLTTKSAQVAQQAGLGGKQMLARLRKARRNRWSRSDFRPGIRKYSERQAVIADIDKRRGRPTSRRVGALPEFHYRDGYTLSLADLGKAGVKIELIDSHEGSAAVILPPEQTKECSRWLSQTLGQRCRLLPEELEKILGRLLKEKRSSKVLERGDKKVIKESLKLLHTQG